MLDSSVYKLHVAQLDGVAVCNTATNETHIVLFNI